MSSLVDKLCARFTFPLVFSSMLYTYPCVNIRSCQKKEKRMSSIQVLVHCPWCGHEQYVTKELNGCKNCHKLFSAKSVTQRQKPDLAQTNPPQTVISSAGGKILGSDWRDVTLGTANGQDVKLSSDDRITGTVLLGATGTGKTSVLEHLAIEDLRAGITSIIFDPHGEIGERLLRVGAPIASDRILFCEITGNLSYGFNPLEVNDPNDPLEVSRTVDSL